MNYRLKDTLGKLLIKSDFLRVVATMTGRRHAILTFHRVRPDGSSTDPFDSCPSVSAELFRKIILHVKQYYDVVPLRILVEKRSTVKPLAAITFDDGWGDNYDVAFRILYELGIPATVFVTAGKISNEKPFWQQTLGSLFRDAIEKPMKDKEENLRRLISVDETVFLNKKVYLETVNKFKSMSSNELKKKMAGALVVSERLTNAKYFLSTKEIQEMVKFGIEVGSHTLNHVLLREETDEVIDRELLESKRILEDIVGKPVDMISYPQGHTSKRVMRSARALGYTIGCGALRVCVSQRDDPLRLPRINPDWEQLRDKDGMFNRNLFTLELYKDVFSRIV